MRRIVALLLVAACKDTNGLPAADEEFITFPPGATADEIGKAIDGRPDRKEGIRTVGHGSVYFVILRDGERHGSAYRQGSFHAVIGGGVTLPEGAIAVRRVWAASGQIDGSNEQPERLGVSVAVEPGAAKPYSEAVREAAATFVEALSRRAPLHPDCVLAMGEVAYTNPHAADAAERELAKAARARVGIPAPDRKVIVRTAKGEIAVDVELRSELLDGSRDGIEVGMMFRNGFDGENRGMLFEYANPNYRSYWMRNCRIPIDVAYINGDRIEEIHAMEAQYGAPPRSLRYYESGAVANLALEMPAGWFDRHGVVPGDKITVEKPKPAK